MTSISGSMSAQAMSPSDRMKLSLQSMVSAGSVKSADQSALSSAIDDIDTAMKASSTGASTTPGSMKSKVDSLVDQEVTDGKLTTDQATELKQVFAQATQSMGGHHGHHHVKASSSDDSSALTALDPTTAASTTSLTDPTSSTTTGSTDSVQQSIQTLMSFLQKLEQATSSTSNYTASGTSTSNVASSLLVNLSA